MKFNGLYSIMVKQSNKHIYSLYLFSQNLPSSLGKIALVTEAFSRKGETKWLKWHLWKRNKNDTYAQAHQLLLSLWPMAKLFIHLRDEKKATDRKTDFSHSGSFPKCLQRPQLGQDEVKRQELNQGSSYYGVTRDSVIWAISCCLHIVHISRRLERWVEPGLKLRHSDLGLRFP